MSYRDPAMDTDSGEEQAGAASEDSTYIDGPRPRKRAVPDRGKLTRSKSNKETSSNRRKSSAAVVRRHSTKTATTTKSTRRKQNRTVTTTETKITPPVTREQVQAADPRTGLEFSLNNLERLAAESLQRQQQQRATVQRTTTVYTATSGAAYASASGSAAVAITRNPKPSFIYHEGALLRTEAEHHLSLTIHIQQRGLQALFPASHTLPQEIARSAAHLSTSICRSLYLSPHATPDLALLGLYDFIIFLDDSTSMHKESRFSTLKTVVRRIARICSAYNASGINIRFINAHNDAGFNGIRTEEQVETCLDTVKLAKGTPLGTRLFEKVVNPLIVQKAQRGVLRRPVVVSVVTDGEPTGEHKDTLKRTILATKNELEKLSTPAGGSYGASGNLFLDSGWKRLMGLTTYSGGVPDRTRRYFESGETVCTTFGEGSGHQGDGGLYG
jgi:hypothetical protein